MPATRKPASLGYSPQYPLIPFTDFGSVTPHTPLESLNLNWREKDLPERVRTKHVHRLHPYLGKFIPQLVEIFLRKYKPRRVVDPFCGSGTTLVEAAALRVDSFGADISEFNCLLTKVKTAQYDLDLLQREVHDALENTIGVKQGRLFEPKPPYTGSDYLSSWFAPEALADLMHYRSLVDNYTYGDVLKIILSRAARSARLTTHFDLDFPRKPQTEPYYCYKHSRICKPTRNARKFLSRYSIDTVKRIREFSELRGGSTVQVVCGDSRTIDFPQTDLIVTSPPYAGLIDYHEQHRYAFELLGLPWRADGEIGAASRGNSSKAQRAYVDQMQEVFGNVGRSLSKNARLVIVVHDRRNLYPELARRLGFRVEEELHRHVNRRTGRRSGEFFESVYVWKPG